MFCPTKKNTVDHEALNPHDRACAMLKSAHNEIRNKRRNKPQHVIDTLDSEPDLERTVNSD